MNLIGRSVTAADHRAGAERGQDAEEFARAPARRRAPRVDRTTTVWRKVPSGWVELHTVTELVAEDLVRTLRRLRPNAVFTVSATRPVGMK